MKLVVSVDVEEDGLFCGRYPRKPPGVANVQALARLEFLGDKFGIPLTLLATYPVVSDPECCSILRVFAAKRNAEIGAHLHPWCTPPFAETGPEEPVRTAFIPAAVLRAKMQTLCSAIEAGTGIKPRAFRAGRFDLSHELLQGLPEYGIGVDSSVVPLRQVADGPTDHFTSPADPYRHPLKPAILEVPLTTVPVRQAAARIVAAIAPRLPRPLQQLLYSGTRYLNAAGIHPAWYPLSSMKMAARLHARRGGTVLNMFLHSSELHPGATPAHRTEAAVAGFVEKIRHFVEWLSPRFSIEGTTLSGLVPMYAQAPGGATGIS